MTEGWWQDAEQDPIHQAAAQWFARLQHAAVSPEEVLAWRHWLAASPRNAEAFARLEEVSAMLRGIDHPGRMGDVGIARGGYDGSTTISAWRSRRQPRVWMSVAASVAVAVAAGFWIARDSKVLSFGASEVLATRVGENRSVRLTDGSLVTLGGDTQVTVEFTAGEREMHLHRGEAYFAVAKDRARPFKVRAGTTTVTAVGTEFNVRRRHDRLAVSVVEGKVVVDPPQPALRTGQKVAPSLTAVTVAAGQKIVIGDAHAEPIRIDDAQAAVAWRSGRLVFDREPLREVVQDVNRYSTKRIALEDAELGELMFTGTVVDGNVSSWISSIEGIFPIEATEEQDRIALRIRRGK